MKKGGTIARDSKNQPKKPSEKPLQIPAEKSGVVRLVFTATFVILLLLCLWLYRQLLELILKHGSGWGFDKDSCLVLGGVIVLLSLSLVAMYMLVRVYEVFPPIDVNKSAQDNGLPRMLWLWKPIISDIQRSKSRVEGLLLAFFSYLLNIYAFSVLYSFIDSSEQGCFSKHLINTFQSFYFSVVTMATVGYGDIYPTCQKSQAIVMSEIFIGLIYAVFLFSIAVDSTKPR
jgi:hypothetical protein